MVGDQQGALYGQACIDTGLGKNTYGTGNFLLQNAGDGPPVLEEGLITTIAWGIGDRVDYALESSMFVTGAGIQWLRDGLKIIDNAADTEAMAASLDSNEGVYFVPALTGLGSPHWDPYARGTIVGLTRGSSREHIARAALEAIAYQSVDAVRAQNAALGGRLTELRADGGATANGWLMQFQADMLGVPVVVPEIADTTVLGAAYLAGVATGTWTEDDVKSLWTESVRYEPAMGDDQRQSLHGRLAPRAGPRPPLGHAGLMSVHGDACVFCKIINKTLPASIVYEDADHVAFLDARPLFEGHTLLVPRAHVETLADLPPDAVAPFFTLTQRLSRRDPAGDGRAGTFVAMNNIVSQSVPHLHCHVVPRNSQGRPARLLLAAHQVRRRRRARRGRRAHRRGALAAVARRDPADDDARQVGRQRIRLPLPRLVELHAEGELGQGHQHAAQQRGLAVGQLRPGRRGPRPSAAPSARGRARCGSRRCAGGR